MKPLVFREVQRYWNLPRKLSVSQKWSWQFIRRLSSKIISVLFEEQAFKLQQILVSLFKLIEGVFKAVWHNLQWGRSAADTWLPCEISYAANNSKGIIGWFGLEGT